MAMEKNPNASDGSTGVAYFQQRSQRRRKLVCFQEQSTANGQNNQLDDADRSANTHIQEKTILNKLPSLSSTTAHTDAHLCLSDLVIEEFVGSENCPGGADRAMNQTFYELNQDLIQLQDRVMSLNEHNTGNIEMPALFSDLKSQVENLRNKLEAIEQLSLAERRSSNFQNFHHRLSDSELQQIYLNYRKIWDKPLPGQTSYHLGLPTFDTMDFSDEEMLVFLQHMFTSLEFTKTFNIPLPVLRNFLFEVYKNYNNVPFHNFRHCFCVAQMMYSIICHTQLREKLGDADILILLVSCICHDLDHPGYNNIYQINARTELALRYNDISPLENHHCSVAFRILQNPQCNIFLNVDKDMFKEFREGIIRCILATDMARHNEILAQFKEITTEFDFDNRTHRNLLAMILIKVADISNEARPLNVAEPWLDRLLMEFFQQSDLEKEQGLPVTPFMDREKITKPSSQCSFIGFVLLPLFEALGELFPSLDNIIINPARLALEHYRKLNEAAKDERLRRKSVIENGDETNTDDGLSPSSNQPPPGQGTSHQMVKSSSSLSGGRKSLSGISSQSRQRSRSSGDGSIEHSPPTSPVSPVGFLDGFDIDYDRINDMNDDEEIPATEAEVSEKTVKFKISTDSATPAGRNTCPNSRKGSREKCQIEKDCQLVNCRPEVSDNRRKSFAVLETRIKDLDHMGRKRRSSIRAMDSIDIDLSSWNATLPQVQKHSTTTTSTASSGSGQSVDSLMTRLRELQRRFNLQSKSANEEGMHNRKPGKKKSSGWRNWLHGSSS